MALMVAMLVQTAAAADEVNNKSYSETEKSGRKEYVWLTLSDKGGFYVKESSFFDSYVRIKGTTETEIMRASNPNYKFEMTAHKMEIGGTSVGKAEVTTSVGDVSISCSIGSFNVVYDLEKHNLMSLEVCYSEIVKAVWVRTVNLYQTATVRVYDKKTLRNLYRTTSSTYVEY